ncbi:hypothetical protein IQ22_00981 [Pseudomonas duriflava]|uniref:Uncharacterized protein n=2 Tax=Pseudomonas duriflava TaxID=459528 RepID=A0A562QIG9_9PSED|nr:hypothetical protein IQ22_00981 [Pseudomonas duriflava]
MGAILERAFRHHLPINDIDMLTATSPADMGIAASGNDAAMSSMDKASILSGFTLSPPNHKGSRVTGYPLARLEHRHPAC